MGLQMGGQAQHPAPRVAAGLQHLLQIAGKVESFWPEQHIGQAEILHLIEHVGIVLPQVEHAAPADVYRTAVRDVDGAARLDQHQFMKRMAVLREGLLRGTR
ncbi:hypothetical protein D3C75_993170 [compost metagenome]